MKNRKDLMQIEIWYNDKWLKATFGQIEAGDTFRIKPASDCQWETLEATEHAQVPCKEVIVKELIAYA